MILYLDFDGVLHHDNVVWVHGKGILACEPGHTLFEWESILCELLEPYPSVKIILSTTWVRMKSFSYAKGRLCPQLSNRVIGATFHSLKMDGIAFARLPRGVQVVADATRRQCNDWIAIDDDTDNWPEAHLSRLVKTDEARGLSDPAAQENVRIWLSKRR